MKYKKFLQTLVKTHGEIQGITNKAQRDMETSVIAIATKGYDAVTFAVASGDLARQAACYFRMRGLTAEVHALESDRTPSVKVSWGEK